MADAATGDGRPGVAARARVFAAGAAEPRAARGAEVRVETAVTKAETRRGAGAAALGAAFAGFAAAVFAAADARFGAGAFAVFRVAVAALLRAAVFAGAFAVRLAAAAGLTDRATFAAGFAAVFAAGFAAVLAAVVRFAEVVAFDFAVAGFAALAGAAFARVGPDGAFPLRDAAEAAAFVGLTAFLGGAVRTGAIGSS